ncbi:enoyl-CoA hydratase-related protein [Pseudomaricurvus sp. HS19]|uniref:enoyl-CoA hydratase-related protein n=1 Tax=Pseudomaricurvus sp. HS19 TaxID=2692626 RepID=UPI0013720E84|nr:enoyl-CoA hydratase-related protein [Pseudomaricurvus sp. HS19]MYM64237.1 2-(1,2-epoxy-1,2-dihydrophenyl)acetyl-CoA isomerase [Pseudomaricurvus sp. HS19]
METVQLETAGSVLKLTLNDPASLNAMGPAMAREMRDAVRFASDPQKNFRCLVITGAGRAFCSGGNLGMMGGNSQATESDPVSLSTHHHHVIKLLKNLPYPIITAINGPAAGLGFSYALTGDLIVAAKSAYFLAAFRNVGVSTDGGLSWTLPKYIGWARAKELLLMGNRLSATQALEWGLINRVFDDDSFMAETMALAQEIAAGPTVALGTIRQLTWEGWDSSLEQHLDREEQVQLKTFTTNDAREGAMSLMEKRKAEFSGK